MPRTRKPQTSTPSIQWRGRVANTTTSSLPQVYRFGSNKKNPSCEAPTSSVTTQSPLHVRIVGDNVYHVTLDMEELASKLWELQSLDLSNVEITLWTVDWPITLNGNLDISNGILTVDEATINTLTSTTGTIESLTSTTGNITTLTSTSVSAWDVSTITLETSGNVSVGWTLWVSWATTLGSTLSVTWDETIWWNLSVGWNETVAWSITWASIIASTWNIPNLTSDTFTTWSATINHWATVSQWLTVSGWTNTDSATIIWNANVWWTFTVWWASTFTGDVSTNNIYSSWNASLNDVTVAWNETITWALTTNWATLLNSSLTVVWTTTMGSNASVSWNLNVAWNETVTWTFSAGGDTTLNGKLSVTDVATFSDDVSVWDDLTVSWTSHLAWVETNWSVDITWTLRTSWAINAWNWVYVDWQVESDSVVTTNTTTDNLTVNWNISLWNNATASDFVLQSEKWAANWVTPLDANGKVDEQYLPEIFTTAKCKVVQWVFNNSNTAVVVDEDITADAFVKTSNYQDIVWDTDEVISVGQIVVTSNAVETGSFKVLIVKPVL